MNPSTVRTVFRTIAFAEAVSWIGLLTGSYLKRFPDDPTDTVVKIFGPIHGAIFIGFVVMCFLARKAFGWTTKTFVLALASSIPPFFTVIFEVVADRKGLLSERQPVGATSAP